MLALLALLAFQGGCKRERPDAPTGTLTVSVEQQAAWIRNFNPLVAAGGARWPTAGGVYEPLLVFNSIRGDYVPWLATDYRWLNSNRTLEVTLRDGVKWSDGRPFSADDVVFTFDLLRAHAALDSGGVWKTLSRVRKDENRVQFDFNRTYLPAVQTIAHQPIVPQHVWSTIESPVEFQNESPIGTGPFTEVNFFKNQVYELGRNPHYWNGGNMEVQALRFPAFPSNDQANLAIVKGDVDWAGNFVPAIDRIFVGADPQHHRYWFPKMGSTVFLYLNTLTPPFDRPEVRQALSMSLDRRKMVEVAMFNYTDPADETGLSDTYASWRLPREQWKLKWTSYDPERADSLLREAGFERGPDGYRIDGDGNRLEYDLLVVSGWSDWVRAAQITASGLRELGIDVSVRTYDFGAWFNALQKGEFSMAISWSVEGPTPLDFYRFLMDPETRKPQGEASAGNWHRYGEPGIASVFEEFDRTIDPIRQRELAAELQRRFVDAAPAIPLFPNPSWGVYSTRRFEGFPSEADPYAQLSPNKMPEALLVMTRLRIARAGEQP